MNAVLDEMIERQRQRVADTQEFAAPTVDRPRRADALTAAMAAHRQQQAVLDDLVARRDARTEAIAAHERALEDHADELVLLASELQDLRRALADRVSTAVQALTEAYDASERYDQALAGHSQRLQDAGLSAVYRPNTSEQVEFCDGGYQGGQRRLVLGGRVWERVYAEQVLAYVQHHATAACRYVWPQRFGTLNDLLDDVVRRPAPVPAPAPEVPPMSRLEMWAQR